MGSWLVQKWYSCRDKKAEVESQLADSGIPEDVLRLEWSKQVAEQTRAAIREFYVVKCVDCNLNNIFESGQSKNKGQYAVEEILGLQETAKTYRQNIVFMENKQTFGQEEDHVALALQLEEARSRLETVQKIISKKKAALSIDGRLNLHKVAQSRYLQLRMNAHALKHRIRDRLRQRKFELERLEQAYRHTTSGL